MAETLEESAILWYNFNMKSKKINQKHYNTIQLKFPVDLEKIIEISDPIYTFNEIMEQIDLQKYFIGKGNKMGRPRFDCIKLLKIILFAFMENGYSSLRNIEKLCKTDIRFIWLLDDLKAPSYSTVCNFMNDMLLDSIEDIFNDINSYIFEKEQSALDLENLKPVIYAFWHNRQSFLLYPYRNHKKMCVLVSLSKDGEYIARALPKFNKVAARGSTTHGGAVAFRGLLKNAQLGYSLAITPDGPRGPIYEAKQGVLSLSIKTGLPVIPVGVYSTHKFAVHSWDRFQILLPFGKCGIVYGKPMFLSEGDKTDENCQELTKRMTEVSNRAKELCEGKK